jgi:hypothetical protein
MPGNRTLKLHNWRLHDRVATQKKSLPSIRTVEITYLNCPTGLSLSLKVQFRLGFTRQAKGGNGFFVVFQINVRVQPKC